MIKSILLKLQNFKSYKEVEFDLTKLPSLVSLVVGQGSRMEGATSNGVGKTSLFDGISWVLFGKTSSGLGKDDVILWGQDKVQGEFEFILRESTWKVCRHKKRKSSEELVFYKDGENISGASLKETQELIISTIMVDYNQFINTSFLTSYNAGNFLRATDSQKKAYLESFIPEILNNLKDLAKKEVLEKETALREQLLEKTKIETKFNTLKTRWKEDKAQLASLKTTLTELDTWLHQNSMPETRDELVEELHKVEAKVRENKAIQQKQEELTRKKQQLLKEKESVKIAKEICPTCSQPWTKIKEQKAARLATLEQEFTTVAEQLAACVVSDQELHSLTDTYTRLKQQVDNYVSLRNIYTTKLTQRNSLKERTDSLKQNIAATKEELLRNKKLYAVVNDTITSLEKEQEVLAFWKDAYSHKGIPAYILDGILQQLQKLTNHVLKGLTNNSLAININSLKTLKTAGKKEEIDIQVLAYGDVSNINSCSGGERARIEIAVALALRELYIQHYGNTLDILILDEILANLDYEGSVSLVEYLIREYKDTFVFIITHQREIQEQATNLLTINLNNEGYSEVII